VIDRVVYDNHEPLVSLAAAAAVTDRIELVTDVLIAPIRAAALLAKQPATLDRLCGGRLTLGLGLSGRAEDFTAVGMLTDGRGRRFDTQLRALRKLGSGDRMGPAPARPGGPPLLVAGYAPRDIERAARLADGWSMGVGTLEQFREGLAILCEAWARHRRGGQPRTLAMAYFAFGPGGRDAVRRDRHRYYGWLGRAVAVGIADGALTARTRSADGRAPTPRSGHRRCSSCRAVRSPPRSTSSPRLCPGGEPSTPSPSGGPSVARRGSASFRQPRGGRYGPQTAARYARGRPDLWTHLL
jgi:alkanesulfonate monooxygenase SsuD/methylene tetrahydromethanopterin reductase-like flavin-dependent oxidoreductase (luciferase family)